MRAVLFLILVSTMAGCAINQGMTVKHTAHYNAQGQLSGYTVEETVFLPKVMRPLDRAQSDVILFETGTTMERHRAYWPPPRSGKALRTVGAK